MKRPETETGVNVRNRPDLSKILFLVLGFISSSCGNDTIIEYYDTGETKSVHEIHGDVYHGVFREYFKNGEVERMGVFQQGKLDGMIQTFFESGAKRSIMEYRQGKLNGSSIGYFKSGNVNYRTEFVEGTRVGWTINFFDSKKKLIKEQKLYNSEGKMVYLKTFDKNGKVILNQVTPYLKIEKDTVSYNEHVNAAVHVGFKVPKTIAYFGLAGEKFGLLDTLAVDTLGDDKTLAKFSVRINHVGRVKVGCVFSNSSPEMDSTNLRNIFPSYWILVGNSDRSI